MSKLEFVPGRGRELSERGRLIINAYKEGHGPIQIARALGYSKDLVFYYVYPHRNLKKRLNAKTPAPCNRTPRCWKRHEARKLARERWRADGCTRPLYRYYQGLECL